MSVQDVVIIGDHTPREHHDLTAGMRGLVNRDPIAQAVGYSAAIPPAQIKVYSVTELTQMARDLEQAKARLSDILLRGDAGRPIPSLDQNGQGYCATADTEVLTEKGFVPYPEYNWTDLLGTVNQATHELEFQAPFEKHVYEYDGPMIYSTNRRLDFGVTPDHQMYVRKWDERRRTLSDRYSFCRAGDIGWYAGMLASPSGYRGTEIVELEVPDDRRYDGDDFFAMLGLIVSDGYAGGTDNTRNWVSFASFREETRPGIAALAARLGFHEIPSRRGVWIRYDAGGLARWIRANCYVSGELGSKNKRVPDLVKCASMRQIKHFLHYFDDRSRNGLQFYSTSKRLIDDLQELFMRIGKRSHIGDAKAKDTPFDNAAGVIRGGPAFVLTVGEVDRLCIDRKKHIETERYKGLVYCAAVPNHTLITRRNGSVLISSNCWVYGTIGAIQAARARSNMPYKKLSGHSVACKVKNFRDEGGWGALALEYIAANGCPDCDHWPEKSMSRQHDKPETWANAKLYLPDESFADLASPAYDRNLSYMQQLSCLADLNPTSDDYDHWGHCTTGCDVVVGVDQRNVTRADSGKLLDLPTFDLVWGMNDPVTQGLAKRGRNSWTDSYGDRGFFVLTGSKAVGNNSVAICSTTAA